MPGKAAIILGASGSVGEALLAEIVRCGRFGRVFVMTRRPLGPQAGAAVVERSVPVMD